MREESVSVNSRRIGEGLMTVARQLTRMEPSIREEEIDAVTEVLEPGSITEGSKVTEFEFAFADAMDAEYAVAVSSCATALRLALIVAGVQSGDDVVVPSLSYGATTSAPGYVGARAVFADVEAKTGIVTAETVAAALTPSTTAVIVVDHSGVPVDLDRIRALCDPRGIMVIEDAACGSGAIYRDRPVGAGAAIATWSLPPQEGLTIGGGMITTSSADWALVTRGLRAHGTSLSTVDCHRSILSAADGHSDVGFDYWMTDLQAALGLVQLRNLPAMVDRRRELAEEYQRALRYSLDVRCIEDPEWGRNSYQSFWVEIGTSNRRGREGVLKALAADGVLARPGAGAAHRLPTHALTRTAELPVTDRLTDSTVILPLSPEMTVTELRRIAAVVRAE